MTAPRNCLYCKHCHVDGGSAGYSEWTPGSPAEISCEKSRWSMNDYANRKTLAKDLETAATCELFEEDPA